MGEKKNKQANQTCNSSRDADHCLLPGCQRTLSRHMRLAIASRENDKKHIYQLPPRP